MDFEHPDLRGFRKSDEKLQTPDIAVYDCACLCGGHVQVSVQAAHVVYAVRTRYLTEGKPGEAHCFGDGFYIEGHEPMGIAGEKLRTGKRAFLRANT